MRYLLLKGFRVRKPFMTQVIKLGKYTEMSFYAKDNRYYLALFMTVVLSSNLETLKKIRRDLEVSSKT